MPANDVYELNSDATYAGQSLCNTFHFRQEGSDGTGDGRDACMLNFLVNFSALLLDCVVGNFATIQLRCRKIKPTETQALILANPDSGSVAGEGLPPQSCAILRQHATPSGRKGTGHIKIAGVAIAAGGQGRLDAAQLALITLLGDAMKVDQTDGATGYVFRMGVYSQVDTTIRDIVSTISTPRIKTCYSRSSGVGI